MRSVLSWAVSIVFIVLVVSCGARSKYCVRMCHDNNEEKIDPRAALELMGFWGRWDNLPVIVQADSGMSESEIDKVKLAAQQWNDAAEVELIRIEEGQYTYDEHSCYDNWLEQSLNVVVVVDDWSCSQKSQFVLGTTVWKNVENSDVYFQHGGVYLNGSIYTYESSESQEARLSKGNKVDLVRLATHEFGHLLGLGHTLSAGDVMEPGIKLDHDYDKPYLSPQDITRIRSVYAKNSPSINQNYYSDNSRIGVRSQGRTSAGEICDVSGEF
jgi:predicted Zn-dependent protease